MPLGVVLDGRIEKSLHLREGHNFVEIAVDLNFPHSEKRAIQIDVLAARQLRVEADAYLQQAAKPPANFRVPLGRLRYLRQNFQ